MSLPKILYKYITPSTTLKVLRNSKLRWSSPLLFNDLSELKRMPRFHPTVEASLKDFPEAIARLVYDNQNIKAADRLTSKSRILIILAVKLRDQGYSREHAIQALTIEAKGIDSDIENSLRNLISEEHISKLRVLCLTTEFDNQVMWGNYAENHKGCVLAFQHIKSLDTPLLEAKKVHYSRDQPVVGKGLDFLLYGDTPELREKSSKAIYYTKHEEWSYEREWRAIARAKSGFADQFSDYLFYPEELESVTLGARASIDTEREICDLLSAKYPATALYKIKEHNGRLERHIVPR
ncbi:DUF2971 domain-containing protein [Pseudomonas sp. Au-Pse12]|uniref:DUF2971 domain-containing protein n=1 Tax=Pseudomonas sp. Au-Pse12 TaxID=2906459 RepID=UPI001E32C9B1|nr:DUF2971 domain-containing protein [Pseudomonas sp. Au-Pse12]MCE4053865.1 DUF2971 domain-containing protein [Pseudomonas sp. Au-Pse12]